MNAPLSNEILKINEELKRKFEEDPKLAEHLLWALTCGPVLKRYNFKPFTKVDQTVTTHLYVKEV